MLTKHKYPIFLKSLLGVATVLSFGIYLMYRGTKEKGDFIHSKGQVTYYADNYPGISRPYGKYKYLIIDSYDRIFELYVSENRSEKYIFKNAEINPGDTIDLYFDENSFAGDKRTNRNVRFIDKNGKKILISNPNDKTAGVGFSVAAIGILVWLVVLKQKGKII